MKTFWLLGAVLMAAVVVSAAAAAPSMRPPPGDRHWPRAHADAASHGGGREAGTDAVAATAADRAPR